jgi:S-DNA-T family DNA segregation ATPase FtsK/SpoIIIE
MARSVGRKKAKKKKSGGEGLFTRLSGVVRALVHPSDEEDDEEHSHRKQEIKGLLLIGLSLFLLVAMGTFYRPIDDPLAEGHNLGGQVGFFMADAAFKAAGLGGVLLGLLGVAWGFVLLTRKQVAFPSLRIASALCFVLSAAFLVEMGLGESVGAQARLPYGPGGWLALQATPFLEQKFGALGLWILMGLLATTSFMLATEMAFYPALVAFREWAAGRSERGEGLVAAVWGWSRQLVLGLWDFMRGAGLGETAEALDQGEPAQPAGAAKRSKVTVEQAELDDVVAAVESVDDEEEDEDEYEEEEEEEDDEEYEDDEEEEEDDEEYAEDEEEEEEEEEPEPEQELKPVARQKPLVAPIGDGVFEPPTPKPGEWKLPPSDLLEKPDRTLGLESGSIDSAARMLEQALASFRVEATVVGAQVGPTVILFELEVSQGTRMNKVTQLSSEIAAALRAQSVRIIAPIPGKATVGIEVPNTVRRKVRLSELVSQSAYDKKFAALPLFIGVDAEGHPIVEDLTRMPHLLIAGTTGSGKSVCINTILASFLLTRSPHDVQLILIDPKMVELQPFANIPHLMLPVVTDMRQATNVLNWAVEKMEGRYEVFKDAGVRNIKGFNALSEDELKERMGENWNEERTPRHIPYIVVVIDEFADLMMASKKDAEQAITRLAQKSRAVGIHVILATQRPSTDVITGVIKGNLPTRIAFQVASKVDSRVILDVMGAEKLLGGGDMLYNPPATSRIKRVQGALVEDDELQGVIDFVCQESAPTFSQELVQAATGTAQPGAGGGFESALQDDMWDDAVRVVLKSKRGSASLLQRALGIGYTRASRLLDMMGEAGIVSEHKGSKAREVLMSLDDWEEMHGTALPQGESQ